MPNVAFTGERRPTNSPFIDVPGGSESACMRWLANCVSSTGYFNLYKPLFRLEH